MLVPFQIQLKMHQATMRPSNHSGRQPRITADSVADPTLVPGDEEEDLDEYCWTPIQLTLRAGDLDEVRRIINSAASPAEAQSLVNAPPTGYYGQTALQAACIRSHGHVVEALLAAGADVYAAGGNNSYRNAFEIACLAGDEHIVHMLLAAGAVVNPSSITRYGGRTGSSRGRPRGTRTAAPRPRCRR